MKIYKKISLLLIFILVFSLVGCQNTSETVSLGSESSQTTDSSETAPTLDSADEKMLVVYFSRTGEQYNVGVIDEGNTAIVAKMIAEKTGADQGTLRRRRRR